LPEHVYFQLGSEGKVHVSKVLVDDDIQVRSVGLGQDTDDIIQQLAHIGCERTPSEHH
jgi:hypothetical protein